jgi:hypothetical protein
MRLRFSKAFAFSQDGTPGFLWASVEDVQSVEGGTITVFGAAWSPSAAITVGTMFPLDLMVESATGGGAATAGVP